MAKWNFGASRKASSQPPGLDVPGAGVSTERVSISKGYRSKTKYRPAAKMESPTGWRATFMSF